MPIPLLAVGAVGVAGAGAWLKTKWDGFWDGDTTKQPENLAQKVASQFTPLKLIPWIFVLWGGVAVYKKWKRK